MTTRDTPFAPGTPCWVDVTTSDLEATKAFYGPLLGWSFSDPVPEFGGYCNAMSDGHLVAGIAPRMPGQEGPDMWSTYISTADANATLAAVTAGGGEVVAPVMEVAELGSMAIAVDPAGASFGIWQPGTHLGFGKYNDVGSVTWDEHHSKAFATTVAFYENVFGWTMDKSSGDTDEFRYYTAQLDGESVAGLMDSANILPPEIPSHWAVYFSVADADEAVTTLTGLGGTVLRPAEDTPFGRMADVADPSGVPFKLHSAKLANPPSS